MATVKNLEVFYANIIFLAFVFIFYFNGIIQTYFRNYYGLRRKGYTPPQLALVMAILLVFSFFLNSLVEKWQLVIVERNTVVQVESDWYLMILSEQIKKISPFLPFIFYVYFVKWFQAYIPRLKLNFGRRNSYVPWRLFFLLIVAILLVFIVASLTSLLFIYVGRPTGNYNIVDVFFAVLWLIMMIAFARYLYRIANLFKKPKIDQQKKENTILYLRSFNLDNEIFWVGSEWETEQMDKIFSDLLHFPLANRRKRNFTDYLSKKIRDHLGVFEGLGNPSNYYPSETFNETYTDDENWKKEFEQKLESCKAIFIQMSNTENFEYELTTILSKKYSEKMFILTKPKLKLKYEKFRIYQNHLRDVKEVNWIQFSKLLSKAGYLLPNIVIEQGTILTFNAKNEIEIVKQNCYTPTEYVLAINEWLLEKAKI